MLFKVLDTKLGKNCLGSQILKKKQERENQIAYFLDHHYSNALYL